MIAVFVKFVMGVHIQIRFGGVAVNSDQYISNLY